MFLNLSDVLYTYIDRSVLYYQTSDGLYAQIITLEESDAFLRQIGGFQRVDRGHIVNKRRATLYDPTLAAIYFDSDRKLSAPVARPYANIVKEFVPEVDASAPFLNYAFY